MKYSLLRFISILLLVSAISSPTPSYAQSPSHAQASEESKEMNCCDKMEMMQKEMKSMMESHKKMKDAMSTLFNELQQTGKMTQEQIDKIKSIEQMMNQMEEKMKQMPSMEAEEFK
ncbi:hypothetical protein [Niallia taxi]|uniref:hypothetical protein n=1 Tax=Niallia taxi TaxID=2499688 RepID=UPI002E25088B|nr:hypothetical protein [Niallia taxi]